MSFVVKRGTFFICICHIEVLSLYQQIKTIHTYEKDFLHRNGYRNFRSYTF